MLPGMPYGLHFEVNEKAFEYESIMDVLKTTIADLEPIRRPPGMILPAQILESLLARISAPSRAIFVLRSQGYIEITTTYFFLTELFGIDRLDFRLEEFFELQGHQRPRMGSMSSGRK